MMLAAGLPLLEALIVIKGMTTHKIYQRQFTVLIDKISEGASLSEGASGLLPSLAIGSLRAAERAGNLEEVLENLSKYYEARAEIEEKIVGALLYPCFVLILSLASFFALVLLVLPGMKDLFADLGAELPLVTILLINLCDLFVSYGIMVFVVMSIILLLVISRIEAKRREQIILGLPLIGKLYRQELVISSFATLGALIRGGNPIMEALAVTAASARSQLFQHGMLVVRDEVSNGESLSACLERTGFFPSETIQMLKVGEKAGRLDEMLLNISGFISKEREVFLKRFTAMLEPIMTLSVGVVVGFIVIAIFLPIMNVISSIK
jgi:type IV pilus assembly protein PilC